MTPTRDQSRIPGWHWVKMADGRMQPWHWSPKYQTWTCGNQMLTARSKIGAIYWGPLAPPAKEPHKPTPLFDHTVARNKGSL